MKSSSRRAFTLIELMVVIAIIGALMAILLPALEHARHEAYIEKCASNLRQIGIAMTIYCNEHEGNFPRTLYIADHPLSVGTGVNESDSFQTGQPQDVAPNDVTASVYLLLKSEHLPPEVFICPYNDETSYTADQGNPRNQSNFTDWTKNLSYSFADPYPGSGAASVGYRLTSHIRPDFPIAADLNPGVKPPESNVTLGVIGASSRVLESANSVNHEQDGQNVLYADGHVEWQLSCLCGISQDNIYTDQTNQAPSATTTPQSAADAVLLPAASQ